MSWIVLLAVVLALIVLVAVHRRGELGAMATAVAERATARERGSHAARLQYPHIDLTRCLGCGTCVRACPEEGVLDLVHGQAVVVHGARCVGHGRCAEECPTGAIVVTLGDIEERRDLPALDERFEVPGSPGLFLAGEVTGFALIRTAIAHGTAIAAEVARRSTDAARGDDAWDLCIVGAGPAGLACSLEAKARGLRFLTLEQEELGGTVAKYPRRKLVLTQPVELPLVGTLDRDSYVKEELTEMWERVVREHELPIHVGECFRELERTPDGCYLVHTERSVVRARNVCLALGRRGTPRKLDVPGEELAKVVYGLVDARSYQDAHILVVGGGDSAVEAALGLAETPGNVVTLSYRREAFFRLKARNEARLAAAIEARRLSVRTGTEVVRIGEHDVELRHVDGDRSAFTLPNDDVFVLAGGIPPFELLGRAGVSFDPADRPQRAAPGEQGSGLRAALLVALGLTLAALGWLLVFREYYTLAWEDRADSRLHGLLRPSRRIGLCFGLAATALMAANLCYLLRRAQRWIRWGSLRLWMASHLVTGILALICALLHGAMAPRPTVGGYALLGLVVLVLSGAIGRYFYAFVPRAANGRELALDDVRAELARFAAEWDRGNRQFGERVQAEVRALVASGRWSGSFLRRFWFLARSQSRLHGVLQRLRAQGVAEGVPSEQLDQLLGLARRAQRVALMATHFEELRGLLASWRWVHRWTALLVLILLATHVLSALRWGLIG